MSLNTVNRIRFRYFTAFGLIVLALWGAIGFVLQTAEREAMEKASAEGRNLARSLAEHVASSVRAIDLSLKNLSDAWGRDPGAFATAVARQEAILKDEPLSQVAVIDRNGWVVYTDVPGERRVDLSDRQYFKVHQERGTDELYISAPFVSRLSGKLIILFTRPLYDSHRQFAGAILLSVPPPALERIYNDIELGDGGAISLVRADGQILARSHDLARAAMVSLAEIPELGANAAPAGEFRRKSKIDGLERLYRYQKVSGYPLTLFVGQAVDTILAPYRTQRMTHLVAGALATALLLIVTLLLISRRRIKEEADRYRARAETELRRSEEHLRALFDSFPIGVAYVDKGQRVTFANRAYRTSYGADPAGRTVRDVLGEQTYAAVKPYIERALAGDEVQFERSFVREDGETRTRSRRYVPDRDASGEVVGFIGLSEDVTERKRAETRIRKLNEDLEQRVRERTAELSAAIEALQTEVEVRRLAETSALSLADRLQNMARRLGQAQEVERRRLAAELHDGVCSNLAAIGLNLVLLQKQLPMADAASMERRLSGLIALIDEAKANAKDISVDLRPLLLDDRDLLSALEEYARKFEGSTGIAVEVKGADSGRRLPAEEKIALFRITQEALTNCAKHARAKAVAIELNTETDHLALSIADDGIGIDLNAGNGKRPGLGLLSMQERAEAIGGKWHIESAPGKGTRVIVRVDAGALV
jgi:PAS domain S-box-containing protein